MSESARETVTSALRAATTQLVNASGRPAHATMATPRLATLPITPNDLDTGWFRVPNTAKRLLREG